MAFVKRSLKITANCTLPSPIHEDPLPLRFGPAQDQDEELQSGLVGEEVRPGAAWC